MPPITAEQLPSIDDDLHRVELLEGRLRIMEPGGTPHSVSTLAVARLLGSWIHGKGIGIALSGAPGFIVHRDPDTVRAPDFAFIRRERVPDPLPEGYPEMVPDFGIEIVGRRDHVDGVNEKAQWWLGEGVAEVWVLDPRSEAATVHRAGTKTRDLGPDQTIEASGPLAGFSCRVAELFGD